MTMKKLQIATLGLAAIGTFAAVYLTYTKLARTTILCVKAEGFDCDLVNASSYSQVYGVPIAVLGLLAYITIIAIILLESRIRILKTNGPLLLFGISLAGTLYSAYLSYLEAFVLKAWCQYCLISALSMTAIFVLAIIRLVRQPA
jgi:uncharacterized membrane protein